MRAPPDLEIDRPSEPLGAVRGDHFAVGLGGHRHGRAPHRGVERPGHAQDRVPDCLGLEPANPLPPEQAVVGVDGVGTGVPLGIVSAR